MLSPCGPGSTPALIGLLGCEKVANLMLNAPHRLTGKKILIDVSTVESWSTKLRHLVVK